METGIPTIHFQEICSFQGRYSMRLFASFHTWIHPKWHFCNKTFPEFCKQESHVPKETPTNWYSENSNAHLHGEKNKKLTKMESCTTQQINNKKQSASYWNTGWIIQQSAYTTPQKYWKAKEGVTFLRTNPAHRSFHNLKLTRVGGVSCPDSGWTHCKRCSPKSPEVRSAQVIEQTKPFKWLSRYLQDILVKLLDSSINC